MGRVAAAPLSRACSMRPLQLSETQISPLAVTSGLSPKMRYFIMLAEVDRAHEKLMPDLSASLDVELSRVEGAIVVPRDAIREDGDRRTVRVRQGSGFQERDVKIGALSAHEALVTSGLDEAAVIERNVFTKASR